MYNFLWRSRSVDGKYFLFVTVARRGDGDIPGLGGGLAPALGPAVRLRVGAPGLHQLGQGHH